MVRAVIPESDKQTHYKRSDYCYRAEMGQMGGITVHTQMLSSKKHSHVLKGWHSWSRHHTYGNKEREGQCVINR